MKNQLRYICYLSFGKVENLYAQIADFSQSKVKQTTTIQGDGKLEASTPSIFGLLKGGLEFGGRKGRELVVEGEVEPVQKLKRIVQHLEKEKLLADLNQAIADKTAQPGYTCFAYRGEFQCLNYSGREAFRVQHKRFVRAEEKATAYSPIHGISGLRTTGSMCVLPSECSNFRLYLACSMKYFSDMGGRRVTVGEKMSDDDLVEIVPHSGNHFFFAGKYKAIFDCILFLTGQKENELYGSPLALINDFSPVFAI